MQFILQTLSNRTVHRQVLWLAVPMVLSNITVPLLGLIDAAVIGHLDHAWYLGGVALGSTMISVTLWLLGFLRMSTTGLTAQAVGSEDPKQLIRVLLQGLIMAIGFATVFLLFHRVIADLIFQWSDASEHVKHYGYQYFTIRVWSAPASLANYVLLGWLLGTQNARAPMWMVIITNLVNIVLDLLFVVGLNWKVEGAALASVISDYVGTIFALICVVRYWISHHLPSPKSVWGQVSHGLVRFIKLNRDIFLRSLCLQVVFSLMTFQGAALGDKTVAANAVLMSFVMFISYGMDGFAYAMEALVGKSIGAKSEHQLKEAMIGTVFWSLLICALLTMVFGLCGDGLVGLITDIPNVHQQAMEFMPWLVAMPLVSMWCYLLDGVFIGATKGKEMRNSMFVAAASFFILFWSTQSWGNHGLWLSMLTFMAMRGLTLSVVMAQQWKAQRFLV
ncbi:MATE family efflux transporter DinF [Vibrio sp. CAIM 722]|uniref:MATE family efflux transporter DinF n=1 Tax=Vibrio eleionomae TaxID=2653505 RepID=A0A7X4LM22_9VIBR|nr:MATE family efflux transporter DinF [Vibrio eleionomae]